MTHRTGAWIEQQHADQIDARLDRMLASPARPVLAWIGIKGDKARTVHVKGRDGQTEQIEHDPATFGSQIEELAQAWGNGDHTAPAASLPDADSVYDQRRQQVATANGGGQDDSATDRSASGLPDSDSVYARRARQPIDEQ